MTEAVIACTLLACRSAPPPTAAMVPVSAVDAGAPLANVDAPVQEDDRQQLAKLLDEMVVFAEEARARCAGSDSATRTRVLQTQAQIYADRDEMEMRDRANAWPEERRVDQWLHQRRESLRELRELVTTRCTR